MTRSLKHALIALFLSGLFLSVRGASAEPSRVPLLAVAPFLYPPYPGSAVQGSVFDHSAPNYIPDNRIVAFTGDEARRNCPSPQPPGTPPPQAGVCDAGDGIYWSYSLGDWVAYDGHDGIDYGISYRPIYAAADADQVIYAGWWDPQNHAVNLGIYVRLHHSNGYNTYYGHMSSVSVQACSAPACVFVPHGEMLGISGTTGNSTGPHLHLLVRNPANKSVDPYGWTGTGADPWVNNQKESLWVAYPSLVYYGAKVFPSGDPLDYPAQPPAGIIIDDTSAGFSENPAACWTTTTSGSAQNGNMRYAKPQTTAPSCTGQWDFPQGSASGIYSVYIRIPAIKATTQGALYTIQHAGRADQIVINQNVFPNSFYVKDGWVYVGKYDFTGAGAEYIQLTNRTQDETTGIENLDVGADAVRFIYLGDATPTPPQPVTVTPTNTPTITRTPTPSRTPTASRTPTITPTPTASRTSTATRTPTITRTPTASVTPSRTRTPTHTATGTLSRTPTSTRTPTKTRTPTRTPTATFTRRPTATPLYYKIKVYFVNKTKYNNNTPPFEVTGERWAKSSLLLQSALIEYFKGPGAYEKTYFGYIGIYNGFTGYSKFELRDGVAHVYLKGVCASNGRDYNVADVINLNLKQFPVVNFVKIYDQFGQTQNPDGLSDSEPICLSPSFTPSPTPSATPTVTRTPSRTPTPTNTRPPTATPLYVKVNMYFVDKRRLDANTPPFEVAGVRWSRSNNVIGTTLDEYFKGPGLTEKNTYGWIALYNGATGYSKLEVKDGIARVYLKGACNSNGATYTIANVLKVNLKQFPSVQFVKIYDQNGSTEIPDGPSDSIPACLEP